MTTVDVLLDPVRLHAVDELGLLDMPSEDRFDRVTRTAARVLDAPVTLLTLVTADAVVVLSAVGADGLRVLDGAEALCTRVVRGSEPLLVPDTLDAADRSGAPSVVGLPGYRAYAGVPLRGPGGQVVGTLCALDVRPRAWTVQEVAALVDLCRWAEAELARGDAERQRALGELAVERMKDELISVVSHELRTPLTSLKGALALLTAGVVGTLPPAGQDMARIALDNADRLARLVDEICDLERLSAGQVVLERQPQPVGDLARSAVSTVAAQAELAGVTVSALVGDVHAWLDGPRLRSALEHLLANAVRASSPGAVVELRGRSTEDALVLEVEDRGCGIDAQDLDRVFGAFTRGDSSDARAHGGTGLGLALARSVVEAHGGRLSVVSTVGRGTTFTVVLPQRAPRRGGVA